MAPSLSAAPQEVAELAYRRGDWERTVPWNQDETVADKCLAETTDLSASCSACTLGCDQMCRREYLRGMNFMDSHFMLAHGTGRRGALSGGPSLCREM